MEKDLVLVEEEEVYMSKFKVNKLKCAGCGVCVKICPYGAIKIGKDGKAIINKKKCQNCGK